MNIGKPKRCCFWNSLSRRAPINYATCPNEKMVVPPKYADTKKALLKVNVRAGSNVHDFKLEE